jgi:lipoprotein-anchoring transpeptidase ErfK/SrfK
MTTLGRTIVTVLVVGVLVGATAVAAHFLWPRAPEPMKPVVIETPVGGPPVPAPSPSPAPTPSPAPAPSPLPVPVPAPAPVPAGPGEAMADEGLALLSAGRIVEAQKRLSEALRAGVGGARAKALRDALGRCSERLQFARHQVDPGDPCSRTYAVVSGDMLTTIGQKFLVPYELLMRVNGLTSTSIYADQPLKVIQGPIHVEILKSAYELRVWLGNVCLAVCPVGLGAGNSTPEGAFLVEKKLKNPPYQPQHKPRSEFRPGGHPENPLGTRWIDIGNHYGIHGTIDPASIGGNVSEGCIRMHNRDVEMLYDLLVPGVSKVTIRP